MFGHAMFEERKIFIRSRSKYNVSWRGLAAARSGEGMFKLPGSRGSSVAASVPRSRFISLVNSSKSQTLLSLDNRRTNLYDIVRSTAERTLKT